MKPGKKAGQAMVEYALLLALVVLAVVLILNLLGLSVRDIYCRVAGMFSDNICSAALCQDDFTDLSGSQGQTGGWTASNGQACIKGGGTLYNKCSMKLPPSDYTVSLSESALTTGDGYGIFFRATIAGSGVNGYAFQYDPGANGFVIRKWVSGREIFSPTLAQTFTPGFKWYDQSHILSVRVVGNTFTGSLDGKVILTAQDSTYASGGAGIRTWDNTGLCVGTLTITPP